MSYEVAKPEDLLSAYLSLDVAPEERAAVERLLEDHPIYSEQLEELRELLKLLNEGKLEISQAAIDGLRRTITQKIQEKQIKALVTVSVTGDLNEKEKADVQAYLNQHPSAVLSQKQAAATATLLKGGDRTASDALADKLRAKLNGSLPAGVMTPKAVKNDTVQTQKPDSGRRTRIEAPPTELMERPTVERVERPSLRVFVTPENPWKKRFVMASGIAALLAIAFGARAWWKASTKDDSVVNIPPTEKHPSVVVDQGDPRNKDNVGTKDPEKIVPRGEPVAPAASEFPKFPIIPRRYPVVPPELAPKDEKNALITPEEKQPLNPTNSEKPKAPENATQPPIKNADPTTPEKIKEIVPNSPPTPNDVVREKNNTVGSGGSVFATQGNKGNVPPVAPGPGPAVPPVVPPKDPNPLAPTDDVPNLVPGTVGAIKNGAVRITSKAGVLMPTPVKDGTIDSGSRIDTDTAMMSIILPGQGRLYIQPNSSLTVDFGTNSSITLYAGEVYYIAPAKGSLSLTAGKATATKVTEADIKLSGGRLVVQNLGGSLTLTGRSAMTVATGAEGSVAADGSDSPRKDDPAELNNGLWRGPVLIEGDIIKAPKGRRGR